MASNSETNEAERSSEKKLKYPKSVFLIVGNEFCERFAYYGLRTILTLYLHQRLYFSEAEAAAGYHTFQMLAYFFPVIGAIMADSFFGKFRTILYLSIIYACGCIILAIGAYPHDLYTMVVTSSLGLGLIAFGTGGIKPCVSAFGGDQFQEGQVANTFGQGCISHLLAFSAASFLVSNAFNMEKELARFFSLFYLSINFGSLLSTFVTPIFREDVKCFGEKTCFPLAFGVPAALMIVALILFICGKPFYIIIPRSGNIVLRVAMCICRPYYTIFAMNIIAVSLFLLVINAPNFICEHAIKTKCTTSEKKKLHWLDYADDKYDKKLIEDIKILLKIFVLYIPLPVFWALFDQKASRWTLQATRLNGEFSGFRIKADQMQILNPFLIIVFIPLFQYAVYPVLNKLHILRTSLQRITAGGTLVGVSFIVAGFLELSLEGAYPSLPENGNSQLTIINNSPCNIRINGTDIPSIATFETSVVPEIKLGNYNDWIFNPENCAATKPKEFSFLSNRSIESMMITLQNNSLQIMKGKDRKTKSRDGEPLVRIFYNIDPPKNKNVSFAIVGEGYKDIYIHTGTQEEFGMTKYVQFPPGSYSIKLLYNETDFSGTLMEVEKFKQGGVYIVYIYQKSGDPKKFSSTYHMVKGNEIHILHQIPQYIIITAGEIMFSVTGLEFSYSQSPNSMKSVVQAAWLLTTAFGNVIIIVIAELHLFKKLSYELFLFATLMITDMAIFAILAYFYKYVTIKSPSEEKREAEREKSNESQRRRAEAYAEEGI